MRFKHVNSLQICSCAGLTHAATGARSEQHSNSNAVCAATHLQWELKSIPEASPASAGGIWSGSRARRGDWTSTSAPASVFSFPPARTAGTDGALR